jgi:hypothetical protein
VIDFNFRFSTASTSKACKSRVHQLLDRHGLEYDIAWTLGAKPFLTPRGELCAALAAAAPPTNGVATELVDHRRHLGWPLHRRHLPATGRIRPGQCQHPQGRRMHRRRRPGTPGADLRTDFRASAFLPRLPR